MDDVDFTVLAATSVLGDLIDKCPPAEACRDAFDRMSKATIQMCMSTTGFGPQAFRSLPQSQQHFPQTPGTTYASTSDTDGRQSDADTQGYSRNASYFSHQPHQRARKPVPRFDMDLKDLFSEDETDKRSFSRVSNQVNTMRPPPTPIKPDTNAMQFTADLKISPQLRTQGFGFHQPTQTQQQQQQQQQTFASTTPTLSPPISQSPPQPLPSPYQLNANVNYAAYAQAQSMSSAYPDLGFHNDLDFLDSFPVQASATSAADGAATQDVGIGFGMGFGDGTHDWSDGNGLDLFDGFFFGPGGTGM